MKLGPVTKLDKAKKRRSKQFGYDVMSANYDVIVIFPIYGQFGEIRKPDSGCIVLQKLKTELEHLSDYCFE